MIAAGGAPIPVNVLGGTQLRRSIRERAVMRGHMTRAHAKAFGIAVIACLTAIHIAGNPSETVVTARRHRLACRRVKLVRAGNGTSTLSRAHQTTARRTAVCRGELRMGIPFPAAKMANVSIT